MIDYGHCTCGEPLLFRGARQCFDCEIKERRRTQERGYVPIFGEGKRLSGATASCALHFRRGCPICFPEVRP